MADDKLAEAAWDGFYDSRIGKSVQVKEVFLAGRASLTDAEVLRKAAEIVADNRVAIRVAGKVERIEGKEAVGLVSRLCWLADRLERSSGQAARTPPKEK